MTFVVLYWCVRGISIDSFYDFLLDIGIVATVCIIYFSLYYQL